MLRLASKASNPGDLNLSRRELSLAGVVAPDTRRPPGHPGPRGFNRLHGSRGAATLTWVKARAARPRCVSSPVTSGEDSLGKTLPRRRARTRAAALAPLALSLLASTALAQTAPPTPAPTPAPESKPAQPPGKAPSEVVV